MSGISSKNEINKIVPVNDFGLRFGITIGERLWNLGLPPCGPFELEGIHFPINFFDIINFLLGMCSPKPTIQIDSGISICLNAFDDQKIFPQRARICAKGEWIEIFNNGIAGMNLLIF